MALRENGSVLRWRCAERYLLAVPTANVRTGMRDDYARYVGWTGVELVIRGVTVKQSSIGLTGRQSRRRRRVSSITYSYNSWIGGGKGSI